MPTDRAMTPLSRQFGADGSGGDTVRKSSAHMEKSAIAPHDATRRNGVNSTFLKRQSTVRDDDQIAPIPFHLSIFSSSTNPFFMLQDYGLTRRKIAALS